MKIAIVHDHLTCKAGGEQVALTFHKAFPNAPIYTLAYNADATFPEFKECDIRTSWFQKITNNEHRLKRLFFPLGILAMRSLYLGEYDIVLTSGTHCSKYVRVSKKTILISYCYTPFRLAWNPNSYAEYSQSSGIKRIIFDIAVKSMRFFDRTFAQRTNFFIAMTQETKDRIAQAYKPSNIITIINPPVNNLSEYLVSESPKEYYLLVSRLEYYKKVDLAISVFNELDEKLIIVGKGSKESELKQLANSSKIYFKKNISTKELADLYSGCKAFIFPQHEDYGLTALEANAAGRPVIAFGAGGVLDTQIPLKDDASIATAVFFKDQTLESLKEALKTFKIVENDFSPLFIRQHAEHFNESEFINKVVAFVTKKAP